MMTTRSKKDNSVPNDTKLHPWRKANSNLANYSRRVLAERKKDKEFVYVQQPNGMK